MARKKGFKIPGLSFSWKRALGITAARQRFARRTGIPTTRGGLERKIGRKLLGRSCLPLILAFIFLLAGSIALLALAF
jgi:hypothetical protein